MCESTSSGRFAEGIAQARTGRRTLLTAAGTGIALSTVGGFDPAYAAKTRKRAYVLVLDGCRPDEITPTLMPRTSALRDGGLNHPYASSVPIMETIPNHVMMMTGVRPDRSGVPANSIYDRKLGDVREMDRPSDIRTRTVIQRLNKSGLTTGTVLSKEYLYGVFGTRATHRWEPAPIVPVSGHAPDTFTMQAALAMLATHDPHLMFVNLGDIDRFGHTDVTGPLSLNLLRQAALAGTDAQVGQFVDALKAGGQWANSIVIVLADHSMDWSRPDAIISLNPAIEADPLLAGKVQIADNGGADLLYWTGPTKDKDAAVSRMIAIAKKTAGVLGAHDPRRTKWLRTGPLGGDVVVFCKAGWRFSDPTPLANPIPGNHGHPATKSIPFFIGGGHRRVPRGKSASAEARTLDVAPTLADFFKVGKPRGGYDGRNRLPR